MLRVVLVIPLLLMVISAYPQFRDKIPNGRNVPHPCGSTDKAIWFGVGHRDMYGGGPRNPFGLDFHKHGKNWTKGLCEMDSDGDGLTNGEELGDPSCTWRVGEAPSKEAIGHPGICNRSTCPITEFKCRDADTKPDEPDRKCNGANTANPAINKIDLRFNPTRVPATRTNYFCKMFDLPSDRDYHISADKPYIDKGAIVHHMLLYACPSTADVAALERQFGEKAAPCGMMVQEMCSHIIAGWAKGVKGDCYDGLPAGTRIGRSQTAFKKAVLEMHWDNWEGRSDYIDASGITLFYTSELKRYDLGVLTIGQTGIKIPPGKATYEETATCSSTCTAQKLRHRIKIISAGIHMHLTGRSGSVTVIYGNGRRSKKIAETHNFDFNTPTETNHYPAVNMGPGDSINMSCIYNSMGKKKTVYYGPATSDEMCYSYISYYPKLDDFTLCLQHGHTEDCNDNNLATVGGCDMSANALLQKLIQLETVCDTTGVTCRSACKRYLANEVCFNATGDGRRYLEYILGENQSDLKFVQALRSCDDHDSVSGPTMVGGCDVSATGVKNALNELKRKCRVYCTDACYGLLMSDNQCFYGDGWKYIESNLRPGKKTNRIFQLISSCNDYF